MRQGTFKSLVCGVAFSVLCSLQASASGASDKKLAEECTTMLYNAVHGKSVGQVFTASLRLFNYENLASRVASANRENWSKLSKADRAIRLKRLYAYGKAEIIPLLIDGLKEKGIVRTATRQGKLLVIVYMAGSRLIVNDQCVVYDAKKAGVSISTLAMRNLKKP